MKKLFFISAFLLCFISAQARHVAGGELFYEYLGPGNSPGGASSLYRITLRLFRDCNTTGPQLEVENVTVGVYANDNSLLVTSVALPLFNSISTIALNTSVFPCLVGNVNVCYEIGIYTATVILPDNVAGYTLSRTGCCRVDRLSNLAIATNVGSNYITKIPGTGVLGNKHNNSPQFFVRDTALVCARKRFTLDFSARDADGDSLSYSFCEAYSAPSGANNSGPTRSLSLIPLPYASIYSGNFPLGSEVSINPATGFINGIAPPEGQYVVNVCITEWRDGKSISEHRKDFILKVQNCDIIEALLPEKIIQCKDSIVHFENLSTSSSITSYRWDFGDGTNNFSTNPTVNYPYADTGMYIARLTVTGPQGCVGSATTRVFVYPGFQPAFSVLGSCVQNPYQFKDLTSTRYGTVNSWRWDLGDEETFSDTFLTRNIVYTYPKPSVKNVKLVVTNNKGCIDSVLKQLPVADKPKLQLPFKDTLICNIDTLAIPVFNTGNFSWLPNRNILHANTSTPLVFPKETTRYIVSLNDNGCVNSDTVTVNVLPFIKVQLGNDSLICQTDTLRLQPVSQALNYRWTSSSGIPVNNVKFPLVQPLVNTQYVVTANLGKCQDRDTVLIRVAPYPIAIAGPDTTICLGARIQLRSTVTGSTLNWTPANSLVDPTVGSPVAGPSRSTVYVLQVTDTAGCRKPVTDTMVVIVSPPIPAQAGRDTAVLANQPLQLHASGGIRYSWYPEYGLSNPSINNPVATLDATIDSIRYRVRVSDAAGCSAIDEILIRVYKTGPDIFVPSAFTPNGDGKNDMLRPVTLGITQLSYFRVYNRWGQLIFTSSELGKGWDGIFNGAPQAANTYIFEAEGTDYTGKTVYRKGTSVLIR